MTLQQPNSANFDLLVVDRTMRDKSSNRSRPTLQPSAVNLLPLVMTVLTIYNGLFGEAVYRVSDIDILGQGVPVTTTIFLPLALVDIFRALVRRRGRIFSWRPKEVRIELLLWLALLLTQLGSSFIFGPTSLGIAYILGAVFFVAWFWSAASLGGLLLVSRFSGISWAAFLMSITLFGFVTGGGIRIMPDNNINLVSMVILVGIAQVYLAIISSKIPVSFAISIVAAALLLLSDFRRTALIAIAVSTVVLLLGRSDPGRNLRLARNLRRIRRFWIVSAAALVGAAVAIGQVRSMVLGAWQYAYDGLFVFNESERLDGDARRAKVMTQGWAVARDHFPAGVGHGHYLEVLDASIPGADILRPHNFVLISTAELGIAGLVLATLVLVAPVVLVRRGPAGVTCAAVAILPVAFMLTNDYVFSPGYWIPTALAFQLHWAWPTLMSGGLRTSRRSLR